MTELRSTEICKKKIIQISRTLSGEYQLTPGEKTLFFRGNPDAYLFWEFCLTKSSSYIPRKKYIRETLLGVGDFRWRKAVKFLRQTGLIKFKYNHKNNGDIGGKEYSVCGIHHRRLDLSKPLINGATHEALKTGVSHEALKTYAYTNKGGEGEILPDPTPMIPFPTDSSPEEHRRYFLEQFPGQQTFQTFGGKIKHQKFNNIIHSHKWLTLEGLNEQGAGVFLTINETDGKGRKATNIKKVRAVFADLDGAPLKPVLEYSPSMVVESSPGRYHAYWLTDDVPLDEFRSLQKSIIVKFGSDIKVHDLPRVMRVPGYHWNKEDPGFMTRIISTNGRKYSFDELKVMFPPVIQQQSRTFTDTKGAEKGHRNAQLCSVIGGLKKMGRTDDQIRDAAYKFGKDCTPPMGRNDLEPVLKSAITWQ